jgi:N-acyl-D-aspartate/D-glutamate deacylase
MDLALRNATLIDGTGKARFHGDLGVSDGRIVAIGEVPGRAVEEIDVGGAVVAPGFIDVHTHYDAQVFWDPMLSPSVYHGVTTVLAGNCGFTLAPLSGRKEDSDYLLGMLARVEGMPLPSLEAGLDPTWKTFGEFLERLDGKIAVNMAFMVGHSTLRRHVMGERAVGHEATAEEIQAMCALLRQSLAEGGTGFSTTMGRAHFDQYGQPVPSRWSTREEMLALASVVSEFPGTWTEMILGGNGAFTEEQYELATQVSVAAQRPLNWNLLLINSGDRAAIERQLHVSDYAAARGGKVYGLVAATPMKLLVNFKSGQVLDMIDGWAEFLLLPEAWKLAILRDPKARARLRETAAQCKNTLMGGALLRFGEYTIEDLRSERNALWKGKRVAEYAETLGVDPLEALLVLAGEEELWLSVSLPVAGEGDDAWALRAAAWRDDRCIIGGSDAGAHVDMSNTFALSTQLLGEGVRVRGLLTLEDAVRRITSLPAERFGLKDRGRLALGAIADLVVFDPDTLDCGPIKLRNDLPQAEPRLYAEAVGVHHVIVGGVPVARDNQPTGRLGGKVLRSGRDTVTAPIN